MKSTDSGEFPEVRTRIPARLDRLPWSPWHWRIIIGLGTVWILDGLEVTIVGNIVVRLAEEGSGIDITTTQVTTTAAALYVAGACVGALFFGRLTDLFGRKKLFIITLAVYLAATAATALADSAWFFFVCRFFTGFGIGGEYAAINSAIDELIPSRMRGRIDLIINGTFWAGAALGALASVALLDTDLFPKDVGWRLSFAIGLVLGLVILLVRRHVPESPRWLMVHGKEEEADRIVSAVEQKVHDETGQALPVPDEEITVRQRGSIGYLEIMRTVFSQYRKRAILGLSLFVGQAFLYNSITFGYAVILDKFFGVGPGSAAYYFAVIAVGNLLGPLILGHFFDSVGRVPMIAGTYILSGVLLFGTAMLFQNGMLTATTMTACWCVVLFFASAGASSAYLTVSEVFPLETRAMCISFFYAVGTALGGITGPILFNGLVSSGKPGDTTLAFCIGAGLMVAAGVVESFLGVKSERKSLESIAAPLSAVGRSDGAGGAKPA